MKKTRARALAGVRRWRLQATEARSHDLGASEDDHVLGPIPRRETADLSRASLDPVAPMRRRVRPRASAYRAFVRLLRWALALVRFQAGTVLDRLRGRDSLTRRAERLRETIERLGGTFVKLGQQLSIRVDLLPLAYCHEFGKLLDRVEPFDSEHAVRLVEESLGRPLDEVFRRFDPEPIGSASVACVYQAVLLSGERVAVKVRRPGIERLFAADWRALGWLAAMLEGATIFRRGQLTTVLRDLRSMIDEELDFVVEARNTHLFRKRAQVAGLRGVDTPTVYFQWSSDRVLVSEFVSGIWLWEVLRAVEHDDPTARDWMERLGVEPQTVARRLYRASLFGIFDSHIFHADPHPANVVVRAGGEVVLIDFGSCGSFSDHQVRLMRQFHTSKVNGDLTGMVQCVLSLLEPLPPIDVDALAARISEVLLRSVRAIDSPNADWWEKTSAGVWLSFMGVVRAFDIRVDLDVLRMIRSTLLYDTLALRLDPELDIYREYQRYRKVIAKRARKRATKQLRSVLKGEVDDRWFLQIEESRRMLQRGVHRLERALDSPTYRFVFLAGKTMFAIGTLARWLGSSLIIAVLGTVLMIVWRGVAEDRTIAAEPLLATFSVVLTSTPFLALSGLLLLLSLRQILLRLREPET